MTKTDNNVIYSFYITGEGFTKWYWTGEEFSCNIEECKLYSTKMTKKYLLNNYLKFPQVNKMLRSYVNYQIEIELYSLVYS